ncbi:unnamed protein product [Mytilus coruscus]|uniref:Uncharacterized protein n=1 Tax=Mytilus coruscus TaxID=42192 RepID=A0A6J8B3W5_MYTCO|nr:unnamed protein product [Mytilus coruscus]
MNFPIIETEFRAELRGLGLATTDELKDVMKLGSFKCFWNRVYIVGPYFSGKSCLAKLLVGDALPQERESTDGIWIYMGRAGMDLNDEEWIIIPKGTAVQEILVSMMMSLSTSESFDTENQTTRLQESGKTLHDSEVSRNSGHVEVFLLENSAQSNVHEERISEIHPMESCDAHDYTFTPCLTDENSHIYDTVNESKLQTVISAENSLSTVPDKNALDEPTNAKQSIPLKRTSKKIVVDTASRALGIRVAATNTPRVFPVKSRTSDVDVFENRSTESLPNESSTEDVLSEESIPSDVQPKQRRSSDLNFAEMYSPGVNKATYFASTEYFASTDVSVEGSITVETALETNKSKDSVAEIIMPVDSSLEQRLQVSQTSNDYFDLTTKHESSTAIYQNKDRSKSNKPVREKYKEKLMKEVANELSHDKLHEMVISSIREGKYKQKIIPIDIWDFGGQKDYYMTHQLFITSRGIFVLVFNGSLNLHKHMPDLSFLPGHFGKPTIAGENMFHSKNTAINENIHKHLIDK